MPVVCLKMKNETEKQVNLAFTGSIDKHICTEDVSVGIDCGRSLLRNVLKIILKIICEISLRMLRNIAYNSIYISKYFYKAISEIPVNKEVRGVCFSVCINSRIQIMPDKMQFLVSFHKRSVKSNSNTNTFLGQKLSMRNFKTYSHICGGSQVPNGLHNQMLQLIVCFSIIRNRYKADL